MSAQERSGWRDHELSLRHRRWGFHCPGVDLDFLLVEYHLAVPVAIVDYKHHAAPPVDLAHPTYRAVATLADRTPALPFLVARYWPGTWAFEVTAANEAARRVLGGPRCPFSEAEYVAALHDLRARAVHEAVLRHLNTTRPPVAAARRLLP